MNEELEKFRVVCDESNNSQDAINHNEMNVDTFISIPPRVSLVFFVAKDGSITFDDKPGLT